MVLVRMYSQAAEPDCLYICAQRHWRLRTDGYLRDGDSSKQRKKGQGVASGLARRPLGGWLLGSRVRPGDGSLCPHTPH